MGWRLREHQKWNTISPLGINKVSLILILFLNQASGLESWAQQPLPTYLHPKRGKETKETVDGESYEGKRRLTEQKTRQE